MRVWEDDCVGRKLKVIKVIGYISEYYKMKIDSNVNSIYFEGSLEWKYVIIILLVIK